MTSKTHIRIAILRAHGAEALDNARKARLEGREELAEYFTTLAKVHARILRRLKARAA